MNTNTHQHDGQTNPPTDWRVRGANAADEEYLANGRDCIDLAAAWDIGEIPEDDDAAAMAFLRGFNVQMMILTAEDPNDGRPEGPRFTTMKAEVEGFLLTLEDLGLDAEDQAKALALGLGEACMVGEGIEIRRVGPAPSPIEALAADGGQGGRVQ